MCTTLVDATNKYLQKHFKDVMKSEEFFSLGVSDVQEIVCRDELNIDSEEQVRHLKELEDTKEADRNR